MLWESSSFTQYKNLACMWNALYSMKFLCQPMGQACFPYKAKLRAFQLRLTQLDTSLFTDFCRQVYSVYHVVQNWTINRLKICTHAFWKYRYSFSKPNWTIPKGYWMHTNIPSGCVTLQVMIIIFVNCITDHVTVHVQVIFITVLWAHVSLAQVATVMFIRTLT